MSEDNLYKIDTRYNGMLPKVTVGKPAFKYSEVTTAKEFLTVVMGD